MQFTAAVPSTTVLSGDDPNLLPLSQVPVGWRRVVEAVDGLERADLEREGFTAGTMVVVTARTPLGGPLIVELGRARLAVSSRAASGIMTRPYAAQDGPTP